jgi:hypothetical protein
MEGDTSNARYWYRGAKREFPRNPSIADEIAALSNMELPTQGPRE